MLQPQTGSALSEDHACGTVAVSGLRGYAGLASACGHARQQIGHRRRGHGRPRLMLRYSKWCILEGLTDLVQL